MRKLTFEGLCSYVDNYDCAKELELVLEDLYFYTNKYWKDVKSRHVRPTTKTLDDIIKSDPRTFNKVKAEFRPFPIDHAVKQLGVAYTGVTNASLLMNQLFENPSVKSRKSTKKIVNKKLHKALGIIKSIPDDLDNDSEIEDKDDKTNNKQSGSST